MKKSKTNQGVTGKKALVHCFILAGGQSQRMGGSDKAETVLAGKRLFDHVFSRISPQVDRVLICGPKNYGSGLMAVKDHADGPKGPVAGLYAAHIWMRENAPDCAGFFTVPVDGPFLPHDLVARLGVRGGAAIAADDQSDHPTFAYWSLAALNNCWPSLKGASSISLRQIVDLCGARREIWNDPYVFQNINSPHDLRSAEARKNKSEKG